MKTNEILVGKTYVNKRGKTRTVISIVKKYTNIVAPETWPVADCDVVFSGELFEDVVGLQYFARWAEKVL